MYGLAMLAHIVKPYIAMGAAGWHVCLDVLDHLLSERPLGRIAGPAAMNNGGWQRLNVEYSKQFGVELPNWSTEGKA